MFADYRNRCFASNFAVAPNAAALRPLLCVSLAFAVLVTTAGENEASGTSGEPAKIVITDVPEAVTSTDPFSVSFRGAISKPLAASDRRFCFVWTQPNGQPRRVPVRVSREGPDLKVAARLGAPGVWRLRIEQFDHLPGPTSKPVAVSDILTIPCVSIDFKFLVDGLLVDTGEITSNDNDDNENGVEDRHESPVHNERSLQPVVFLLQPPNLTPLKGWVLTFRSHGEAEVRLWEDSRKEIRILLPATWTLGVDRVPPRVYVELVSGFSDERGEDDPSPSFSLELKSPDEPAKRP